MKQVARKKKIYKKIREFLHTKNTQNSAKKICFYKYLLVALSTLKKLWFVLAWTIHIFKLIKMSKCFKKLQ